VAVWSTTSAADAGTKMALADAALHGQSLTVSGYTVVGECRRQERIQQYDEDVGAWGDGAVYELRIARAAP